MSLSVVCTGAGWVTAERHVPALRCDPRVTVLGVIDPHPDRAEALALRYRLPHWGTSLDEPWTETADALTVGTPPLTHADVIRPALERGWHCLSEKPLALPAATAAELGSAAAERGLVLAVVHNFQFADSARRLFALVESGRLGRVKSVHGVQLSNPDRRLPVWHGTLPGGLFLDESPHLLYLLRRVLGRLDLRTIDGRVENGAPTNVVATFDHEEIWATLTMTFDSSVSEWQFVVVGERALAALDVFRDVLVVLPNDGRHEARQVLRTTASLVRGHLGGVFVSGVKRLRGTLLYGNVEVVRRFVDAVEGRPDRLRGMSAADGHAVVSCIQEALSRLGTPL